MTKLLSFGALNHVLDVNSFEENPIYNRIEWFYNVNLDMKHTFFEGWMTYRNNTFNRNNDILFGIAEKPMYFVDFITTDDWKYTHVGDKIAYVGMKASHEHVVYTRIVENSFD